VGFAGHAPRLPQEGRAFVFLKLYIIGLPQIVYLFALLGVQDYDPFALSVIP